MKKILVLSLSIIALSGCGDSNVDIVKNVTLNDGSKLGYVLENRKICSDIKWISYEDERGRGRVKYTCVISPENYQLFVDKYIPAYSKWKNYEVDSLNNKIKGMDADDISRVSTTKRLEQVETSFSFNRVDEYKDVIEWIIPNGNTKNVIPQKSEQYSCLKFDNGGVLFFGNNYDKGAPIYQEHSSRFLNEKPNAILSVEFRDEGQVVKFNKECK